MHICRERERESERETERERERQREREREKERDRERGLNEAKIENPQQAIECIRWKMKTSLFAVNHLFILDNRAKQLKEESIKPINLSIHLSTYLAVYLSMSLSIIYLFIYSSTNISIN